jgi:hypothetical protein
MVPPSRRGCDQRCRVDDVEVDLVAGLPAERAYSSDSSAAASVAAAWDFH